MLQNILALMKKAAPNPGIGPWNYIMIDFIDNNPSYREVADVHVALTVGGANQATGGTASSSGDYPGYPASLAFDNNTGNWWISPQYQANGYLKYAFSGQISNIAEVRICPSADTGRAPYTFDILASTDNVNWTTIKSVVAATGWAAGTYKSFVI